LLDGAFDPPAEIAVAHDADSCLHRNPASLKKTVSVYIVTENGANFHSEIYGIAFSMAKKIVDPDKS